jgi:hypothetical protein
MPNVFKQVFAIFFCFALSIHSIGAAGRDAAERLKINLPSISFDVQRKGSGLELIGKEKDVEKFKTFVDYRNFNEFSMNNFYLNKLNQELLWQYHGESGEFFEMLINQSGDITLLDSPQTNTKFDLFHHYGFTTPGIIENRGSQTFFSLGLNARQIHNYGTLQACNATFNFQYMFNPGL